MNINIGIDEFSMYLQSSSIPSQECPTCFLVNRRLHDLVFPGLAPRSRPISIDPHEPPNLEVQPLSGLLYIFCLLWVSQKRGYLSGLVVKGPVFELVQRKPSRLAAVAGRAIYPRIKATSPPPTHHLRDLDNVCLAIPVLGRRGRGGGGGGGGRRRGGAAGGRI